MLVKTVMPIIGEVCFHLAVSLTLVTGAHLKVRSQPTEDYGQQVPSTLIGTNYNP